MSERDNVRNLIRWVAAFVAWPSLSISLIMAADDLSYHLLHIAGLLPLGAAALGVFASAGKLATRWVPAEA